MENQNPRLGSAAYSDARLGLGSDFARDAIAGRLLDGVLCGGGSLLLHSASIARGLLLLT